MLVPMQTLVGRWGQEVWLSRSSAFRTDRHRAQPSSQVCTAIIVPVMVSRCCGLTGLELGQGASPLSPTSHPCQSGTTLLGHPSSLRPTPSSLQSAQLLSQGTQAAFLDLIVNFLCGLRLLAFSEPYFLGYSPGTNGSISKQDLWPAAAPQERIEDEDSGTPGLGPALLLCPSSVAQA